MDDHTSQGGIRKQSSAIPNGRKHPPAHPKAALTQQKKKRSSHGGGGGVQGFRVWGRVHRFFFFCIFLLEKLFSWFSGNLHPQ